MAGTFCSPYITYAISSSFSIYQGNQSHHHTMPHLASSLRAPSLALNLYTIPRCRVPLWSGSMTVCHDLALCPVTHAEFGWMMSLRATGRDARKEQSPFPYGYGQ